MEPRCYRGTGDSGFRFARAFDGSPATGTTTLPLTKAAVHLGEHWTIPPAITVLAIDSENASSHFLQARKVRQT